MLYDNFTLEKGQLKEIIKKTIITMMSEIFDHNCIYPTCSHNP